MSLYLQQIAQLVELQKVDDVIHHIRMEIKAAPLAVQEQEKEFKIREFERNRITDKLDHVKDQQKRLNIEIDEDSARIKKSKGKMLQVGNSKEYQAMMREMDTIERMNRTREDEKNVLLDELHNQTEALTLADEKYTAAKEALEESLAGLDKKLQEAQSRLAEYEAVRTRTSAEVPAPVFARYEFIRHRLDHPVIVPVKAAICSGCNIAIPPQAFIELQRGQQILSCPNCQRLVYWTEHFARPDDEPATPRPAATAMHDVQDDEEE